MSIDAITYAKTLDVDNPMSRLLLFIIAENTFNDSGLCKVGQKVLSDETRASERTVRDHLKKLALAKAIKITQRPKADGGRLFDAIELVGFLQWLANARGIPANSAGSAPNPEPAENAGSPVDTGRQVAGSNKEKNRTSPPVLFGDTRATLADDGSIQLDPALYDTWLGLFGGDDQRLRLALIECAAQIQPNTRAPLEGQVGRILARIAGERHDRDRRYAAAAKRPDAPARKSKAETSREALNKMHDILRARGHQI